MMCTRRPARVRPAVAVLPALLLLVVAGCAGLTRSWTAPEVMVTSIRPQQLALDQQTLLVGLRIRNPNDRMLPITGMTYTLTLEGADIASGGGALERQIPAFGEATAEVTVTGDAGLILRKLPALALQSRPWQYRIAGIVTVAGVVPIPYRYSGEVDPREAARALLR
jgi:LEA14-like dessication related protein